MYKFYLLMRHCSLHKEVMLPYDDKKLGLLDMCSTGLTLNHHLYLDATRMKEQCLSI